MDRGLRARAEAWAADDPDPVTAATVRALLDAGDAGTIGALFANPLTFGTAGLRGPLGPGPAGMNRAQARRVAAGLCRWLDARGDTGPVVVGRDARHGSTALAAEVAAVAAGTGRRVVVHDGPVPTPLLAFSIRRVGAAAGVMVTASHNPPTDNGIKVYAGDGAQIVAPWDDEIAGHMAAVPSVARLTTSPSIDPTTDTTPSSVADEYVRVVAGLRVRPDGDRCRVAYTPLHGVGLALLRRVFDAAGFDPPHVVEDQAEPDPAFPTVPFPNPEEPGAMDHLVDLAAAVDADVALANDPDADRLGVAVPDPGSGARPGDRAGRAAWRTLTGDEIGAVLADHLLRHGSGADRLVASSVVSSGMVARIAAAHGVTHVVTLTGFKWLARAAMARPDLRPVLLYEEALGYCIGDAVRDKDGIAAAVVFVDAVGALAAAGTSVPSRLDALAVEHGLHRTRQHSIRFAGPDGPARMAGAVDALRREPPASLGGVFVDLVDLARGGALPPTDAVVLHGDGVRVVVRPSGTEPKLKVYLEVVRPAPSVAALPGVRAAADEVIETALDELTGRLTP